MPGRAKSQESQLRLPPWGPQSSGTQSALRAMVVLQPRRAPQIVPIPGSTGRTNQYLPKFCSKNISNDKKAGGWNPLTSSPCTKISTISKKNRKIDFFVTYDHHNACYSKGKIACLSILLKNQKGINIAFSSTEFSESQPPKISTMSLIFFKVFLCFFL